MNSPAKINLNLHILGRRPDGYHALHSLVGFAAYGDHLSFEAGGTDYSLQVRGRFAEEIRGENIILKAAKTLQKAFGEVPFGRFYLEKKLPVASGMGGGSGNAAAALHLLLGYIPDLEMQDTQALADLALGLGADVPVCLNGQSVYMSGIGEIIEPASDIPELYALLVNPLVGVSTAKIFKALNADPIEEKEQVKSLMVYDKGAQNFRDYLLQTRNDLEPPALEVAPEIQDVLTFLQKQQGCFLARMSGSGATCFGLFETQTQCLKSSQDIDSNWWGISTIIK